MFRHYLSTAARHFRRHKVTTAINVVCLAIGVLCFLLVCGIALYLKHTDTRFPNAERIVAITQKVTIPGAASAIPDSPSTALGAGKYLKADFPALEVVARESAPIEAPLAVGESAIRAQARYVDSEWYELFVVPFVAGSAETARRGTSSVVLSEDAAKRLFGDARSALGRMVRLYGVRDLAVTGVIGAIAQPARINTAPGTDSQARVDALISMDVFENSERGKALAAIWNSPFTSTFARLPSDGSFTLTELREGLASFGERHVPKGDWKSEFGAIPLSQYRSKYFDAVIGAGKTGVSSVTMLYVLGALVLLVSCINYANLASAQASARLKEIGMRRVVGARRTQLIVQHLCEAALVSVAALLLALPLLALALVTLQWGSTTFVVNVAISSPILWLIGAALLIAITLVAGTYPALVLSRVHALQAVRAGRANTRTRLTTLLVAAQFAAASFLLISILVMSAQNESLKQSAFATMTDPVVVLSYDSNNFERLKTELLRQPHVKQVSASYVQLWGMGGAIASVSATADPQATRRMVSQERVHYEFFDTVGFQFLAGRDFDRAQGTDVGQAVIIDRAMAQQHGWSPESAIGQALYQWVPGQEQSPAKPHTVIGVVENKTTRLVGLGATSNVFFLVPAMAATPIVRIDRNNVAAGLAEIDAVWKGLTPQIAIKRRFADELFNEALFTFETVNSAFAGIAMLAMLIAVLGLIGMSIHSIGRRRHEIGVRKTLGASVRDVLALLLKDFSKPVIVANLIAWPLAFAAMQVYLSIFTQRVGLTWVPFATGLAVTVAIAWLAVIVQATRAARLKPAGVLRYE